MDSGLLEGSIFGFTYIRNVSVLKEGWLQSHNIYIKKRTINQFDSSSHKLLKTFWARWSRRFLRSFRRHSVIQLLHITVAPPTTCTTSCFLFCMFGNKIIYFRTHAAHSVFWDSILYPNFNASLWNLLLIGLEKALKIQSGDREVEFLASTNMLWDKMSFIP